MVKGFIFFRTGKIPFVIENYRMDLFTDDSLLEIFCKEFWQQNNTEYSTWSFREFRLHVHASAICRTNCSI